MRIALKSFRPSSKVVASVLAGLIGLISLNARVASAQDRRIDLPDRKQLFGDDSKAAEDAQKKGVKQVLETDQPVEDVLNFQAPQVEYLDESERVRGTGGVIFSRGGLQAQADTGDADLEAQQVELQGDVLVTGSDLRLQSEKANFNFETETGDFTDARFLFEEEGFAASSEEIHKVSEFRYRLSDCAFSSCHCPGEGGQTTNLFRTPDASLPWQITTSSADVTQEGYAHTYNTTLDFYGIPILYTPYLAFPVKTERASGLLAPKFGYDTEDGFLYSQPLYAVLSDSSDLTTTPFVESRTRYGVTEDFRQVFSRLNNMAGRFIYSDESMRDGDLRGTDISDLEDQELSPEGDLEIDDRFGAYYRHKWRSEPGATVPLTYVSDVRYVSDDLFLREMEDSQIGDRYDRYVTSDMVLRAGIGSIGSAEVGGEYNQVIVRGGSNDTDDRIFQRLPEFGVGALQSFRPFGFNQLGAKLVTQVSARSTDFVRDEGYDGWRHQVVPRFRVPLHYKNFVETDAQVSLVNNSYSLNETAIPGTEDDLDDSDSLTVPIFDYRVGTALERVFELSPDNPLVQFAGLGSESQDLTLRRVKHTIEPDVSYRYIPNEDQDDLPLFDSSDRVRERSLVTFGLKSRLLGRMLPDRARADEIPELTPKLDELPVTLPSLGSSDPLGDLRDPFALSSAYSLREGEIRELVVLGVRQSYDYLEAQDDDDVERRPWTDIGTNIDLYPNKQFGLRFDSNYDQYSKDFSSWGVTTAVRSDRGDGLRVRYTFVDDDNNDSVTNDSGVDEIQVSGELAILERIRLGGFTRYGNGESIENRAALRLLSSCRCWHMDLGYRESNSSNSERFEVTFNFAGLGDVVQNISIDRRERQDSE